MSSTSPTTEILLIPWDPESPTHVRRLILQRKACRWSAGLVESWRALQRAGKMTLQFVVRLPLPFLFSLIHSNPSSPPLSLFPIPTPVLRKHIPNLLYDDKM